MPTPTVLLPKKLCAPGQLAVAAGTLYTVPANYSAKITSIILVNTGTVPINCTIYLVPSGGAAAAANALCSSFTLPADGLPYEIIPENTEGIYLLTGDFIQGLAGTATVITYHLSGDEFQ